MNEKRLLIVSAVRNEAEHLGDVLDAVTRQDGPEKKWIVIDDGSTDGTLDILRARAADLPFLTVLESSSSGDAARDRLATAAEARAFNQALSTVDLGGYTHVMKLDGDVELSDDYLRALFERFDADPGLGIAGGTLVELQGGKLRRIPIASTHVHGALKCYRRDCFEALGGIEERLGWDTIDETYARMKGFRTRSFRDLTAVHRRPHATAGGVLRGRARHGECAYIVHYPPSWVLLRSLKVARNHPRVLSGLAFLFGYVRAALRRTGQVPDPAFRKYARSELRRRMLRGLRADG